MPAIQSFTFFPPQSSKQKRRSCTASAAVTPFFAYFRSRILPFPLASTAARSHTLSTPTVLLTNSDAVNSPGAF